MHMLLVVYVNAKIFFKGTRTCYVFALKHTEIWQSRIGQHFTMMERIYENQHVNDDIMQSFVVDEIQ